MRYWTGWGFLAAAAGVVLGMMLASVGVLWTLVALPFIAALTTIVFVGIYLIVEGRRHRNAPKKKRGGGPE